MWNDSVGASLVTRRVMLTLNPLTTCLTHLLTEHSAVVSPTMFQNLNSLGWYGIFPTLTFRLHHTAAREDLRPCRSACT